MFTLWFSGNDTVQSGRLLPTYTLVAGLLYIVVAGLLVRSQYPEGPATGHLGTGFSWFPSRISEC